MSETSNNTPWIISVIVTLICSPLAIEVYKQHNNIQEKPNPTTESSASKDSLEVKYNSDIRNTIRAYFEIEKEVNETLETSKLDNYASGKNLNSLISSITQRKNNGYYRIIEIHDLAIENIKVLSDELEAKSRVSLVLSRRGYSLKTKECIDYYPRDYELLDVILKRRNNKWLVDELLIVEKNYASRLDCTGSGSPRRRTNTSEGSNERTNVSGSSRRRTTVSGN
jgi:hypothetical protein